MSKTKLKNLLTQGEPVQSGIYVKGQLFYSKGPSRSYYYLTEVELEVAAKDDWRYLHANKSMAISNDNTFLSTQQSTHRQSENAGSKSCSA